MYGKKIGAFVWAFAWVLAVSCLVGTASAGVIKAAVLPGIAIDLDRNTPNVQSSLVGITAGQTIQGAVYMTGTVDVTRVQGYDIRILANYTIATATTGAPDGISGTTDATNISSGYFGRKWINLSSDVQIDLPAVLFTFNLVLPNPLPGGTYILYFPTTAQRAQQGVNVDLANSVNLAFGAGELQEDTASMMGELTSTPTATNTQITTPTFTPTQKVSATPTFSPTSRSTTPTFTITNTPTPILATNTPTQTNTYTPTPITTLAVAIDLDRNKEGVQASLLADATPGQIIRGAVYMTGDLRIRKVQAYDVRVLASSTVAAVTTGAPVGITGTVNSSNLTAIPPYFGRKWINLDAEVKIDLPGFLYTFDLALPNPLPSENITLSFPTTAQRVQQGITIDLLNGPTLTFGAGDLQVLGAVIQTTATIIDTPTSTNLPTETDTPTSTPAEWTPGDTPTLTPTPTTTDTPTDTPTVTNTPTSTNTPTKTPTATATSTFTATNTPRADEPPVVSIDLDRDTNGIQSALGSVSPGQTIHGSVFMTGNVTTVTMVQGYDIRVMADPLISVATGTTTAGPSGSQNATNPSAGYLGRKWINLDPSAKIDLPGTLFTFDLVLPDPLPETEILLSFPTTAERLQQGINIDLANAVNLAFGQYELVSYGAVIRSGTPRTSTPTSTPTPVIPTSTPTFTLTDTPTSNIPSPTYTDTQTFTPTSTMTPTSSLPTDTFTPSSTPTFTPTLGQGPLVAIDMDRNTDGVQSTTNGLTAGQTIQGAIYMSSISSVTMVQGFDVRVLVTPGGMAAVTTASAGGVPSTNASSASSNYFGRKWINLDLEAKIDLPDYLYTFDLVLPDPLPAGNINLSFPTTSQRVQQGINIDLPNVTNLAFGTGDLNESLGTIIIGATPTNTPADTLTNTPTNTPTLATDTNTPTDTPVDTSTNTPSNTPVDTATNTPVDISTNTPSNTPIDTATHTPSNTPTTQVDTPTDTHTLTPSVTDTPSNTPTNSPTNTQLATPTNTPTTIPAQGPWSSLLGGLKEDNGVVLLTNPAGDVYLVGETASSDFPVPNGSDASNGGKTDVFITKFSRSGAILWSTYLGSPKDDYARSAVLDGDGNLYVVGDTTSTTFPALRGQDWTFNGGKTDIFLAKISPTGVLVWSTLLGGLKEDNARAPLLIDKDGNICVLGETNSPDFPISGGTAPDYRRNKKDVVLVKYRPDGHFFWSAYLSGSKDEFAKSMGVDQTNATYLMGETSSDDFSTVGGFDLYFNGGKKDLFVSKFPSDRGLIPASVPVFDYSDMSSQSDQSDSIDSVPSFTPTNTPTRTPTEEAVLAESGLTSHKPTRTPTRTPTATATSWPTPKVPRVMPEWSTYLGGYLEEQGAGMVVNNRGDLFVFGQTSSSNMPVVNAFDNSFNGKKTDLFAAMFDASGNLGWCTYLGGALDESSRAITADKDGNVYLLGETQSFDYPVKDGFDTGYNGGKHDMVLSKFSPSGVLLWSTFLGGNKDDFAKAVTTDSSGNVCVMGETLSQDFPITSGDPNNRRSKKDVFITKFASDGSLLWSVCQGGLKDEFAGAVVFDSAGILYAMGDTASPDFPAFGGYDSTFNGGKTDVFLSGFGSVVSESEGVVISRVSIPADVTLFLDDNGIVTEVGDDSSGNFGWE